MQTINLNNCNFEIVRLKPITQTNVLLKIISIICKGANNKDVEQMLHNQLQTGVIVEGATGEQALSSVLLDSIKGALSTLDDTDRDYLINTLLSCVTVVVGDIRYPATRDELDRRLSSGIQVLKLLMEVAKINFTVSTAEKQ